MEAELTGPGIWFINIVGIAALLLGAFVVVDAWRPVRAQLLPDVRSKLLWVVPQGAFLIAMAAIMIPGIMPAEYRWVVLAVTPVAVMMQVSYLLKVVFPKPPENGDATAEPPEADAD